MKTTAARITLCVLALGFAGAAPRPAGAAGTAAAIEAEYYALQAAMWGDRTPASMIAVRREFFEGTPGKPPRLQATPPSLRGTYLQALEDSIRTAHVTPRGTMANGIRAAYLARMARELHDQGISGAAAAREISRLQASYSSAVLQGYGLPRPAGMNPTTALDQALERARASGVTSVKLVDPSAIQPLTETARASRVPWEMRDQVVRMQRWMLREPRMAIDSLQYGAREMARLSDDAATVAGNLAKNRSTGQIMSAAARSLTQVRAGPYILAGTAVAAVAGLVALATRSGTTPAPAAGTSPDGLKSAASGVGGSGPRPMPMPAPTPVGAPYPGMFPGTTTFPQPFPAGAPAGDDPLGTFDTQLPRTEGPGSSVP